MAAAAFDSEWARSLVGKTVFVELDVFEADDERHERPELADFYGTIDQVTERAGVVIHVRGSPSQAEHAVPWQAFKRFYAPASPRRYVVRQTGEAVSNPDFFAKLWATKSKQNQADIDFKGFSDN